MRLGARSPIGAAALATALGCGTAVGPAGTGGGGGGQGGSAGAGGAPEMPGDGQAPPQDASDAPPSDTGGPAPTCPGGSRPGKAGKADGLKSPGGVLYNVRTPADYVPTVARPLVVVFSPSGANQNTTEPYTGLTDPALKRGTIIAYADWVEPNGGFKNAATVVTKIMADYCIDEHRIYLTGHSDGASVANTIPAFLDKPPVAAVAPSAGGTSPSASDPCPKQAPLPFMIMHSKNDMVFPGLGAKFRSYLIKCQGCGSPPTTLPNGCQEYGGCKGGVAIWYCEGTNPHSLFPKEMGEKIFDFFAKWVKP